MADYKNMFMRSCTFKEILEVIEDKQSQEKYPSLVSIAETLGKKLKKLDALNWRHNHKKGSELKKEMRYNLSRLAHSVSCGVYAFAQITGNVSLRNSICYSFSDFYRPVESTMIGRCRQVLNSVKKVKNPLHFALTPEIIAKFENELKNYMEFMDKPVNNIKNHARIYRQAERLLDQCLSIIQNQLDPLMTIINCSDSYLHSQYNSVRRIKKTAGRKRKYVKKKKSDQQKLVSAQKLVEHKNLSSEIENMIGKKKTLNLEL